MFYVVVANPAQIVVVAGGNPIRVAHAFEIATDRLRSIAVGPQGTRLFCACDYSTLVTIDRRSGHLLSRSATSGSVDTIQFDPTRSRLYAAIGELGAMEVFETVGMTTLECGETELGARYLSFDQARHRRQGSICPFQSRSPANASLAERIDGLPSTGSESYH